MQKKGKIFVSIILFFYRTNEGYYVVAASDMDQGTTFEGSKGTCIVLDSGCSEGVTDYYVAW